MAERVLSRPTLTLDAAAERLGCLATSVAPRNLLDRNRGQRYLGERRERLDQITGQLSKLYDFFAATEDVKSPSAETARERYETMLDLLVHPLFDPAIKDVGDSMDLPEGTAISLLGSGGNGIAQIRTLAASDVTLDSSPYEGDDFYIGPDVDMMLISRQPVTESARLAYRIEAEDILTSYGLTPCSYYNFTYFAYSTQELWEHFMQSDNGKPNEYGQYTNTTDAIFYPLYPKEKGNQMRKEMLERFAQLREIDEATYDESRARIMRFMRMGYSLTARHFGFEDKIPDSFDQDGVQEVQNYFAGRMMAVFTDMFDMAEPPKEEK